MTIDEQLMVFASACMACLNVMRCADLHTLQCRLRTNSDAVQSPKLGTHTCEARL